VIILLLLKHKLNKYPPLLKLWHDKEKIMEHFSKERTLVMVKPDGIQRSLIGEILQRYERVGLKLVGLKMVIPTEEKIEQHYTLDPEWRRVTGEKTIESYEKKGMEPPSKDPLEITAIILANLKKYMTSGPIIAMVWQGAHAVKLSRKITGGTEPLTSDVGTIRGDYVLDSYQMSDTDGRAVRNLIHASGSVEEANMEIKHWFNDDELIDYRLIQEQIMYDVNLDGILE
jgi:nucleoside-diphosphate kinase